ncbi:palmitoyl-acyl carrier protein thioesterase, chloroplastic-like [Bidens hawaiensis]|uniref:palmitoyl-acyl carrier protein thioesterase, chloroplastic-like n=1 Tax=Bidens hawaiensis TaxID=980011 RepID=UPI0040498518
MVVNVMTANAFCFSNSFSYHCLSRSNLRRGAVDEHGITKNKDASSWGLVVKDITKVHATKIRTIFWKPKMMLDQNKNYPYMVGDLGLGRLLKDDFVFRQNFHIRSYEVGAGQTVTTETLINLMQETCINHVKAGGAWGGGLGSTHEMCKKNLIWVMAKLQMEVDRYPIWDDVIQIDLSNGAYGKIGMCSNWTFCDAKTGEKLLRASCIWLMMNEETRKLSKFPDEVRNELDVFYTNTTPPTIKEDPRKFLTLGESIIDYTRNGIKPRWSDLDINQHVNNAKYFGWILESVPYSILENYELASMTLEYFRECRKDSVLQSCTYVTGTNNGKLVDYDHVDCEHVLRLEVGGGEIMKGWTSWRSKHGKRLGCDGEQPLVL